MKENILYEIDKLPPKVRHYFEYLFQVESHEFLKTCKIVTKKCSERFVSTGEIVDKIWICLSGTVKVMEEFKTGETYIFTEFTAPEIYGEMEALAEIPLYGSSLVAATDCIFIVGDVQAYLDWMQKDVRALYGRAQELSKQLMEEGKSNRAYLLLDGMERIKIYFLDHYTCKCGQSHETCVLKNTRQQISDETGYSVKTVNRVIKKLSEQDLLKIEGQRIIISHTQYKRILESIDEKIKYKH